MTPVIVELLDTKSEAHRLKASSPEAKVAVDVLVLTLIVGLMNHIDDDGDASPVFSEVLRSYVRDLWTAGIEPEVVLRDGIEFGVWEDYRLTWDYKVFLGAIRRSTFGWRLRSSLRVGQS